jgi:hypothetical protein
MANAAICPNDPNGDGNTSDEIKCTAAKIASGDLDPAIRNWAQLFKAWSDNGNKRAFLVPLQEMNGAWIDYFGDPVNYRKAYVRIQQIFYDEGVDPGSVSWIFGPNAWSELPEDNFEHYYPGDSVIDIVGFSSFNWGDCWPYTDPEWYEDIYEPYLDRMAAMAPGKAIFVVEIASVPFLDGDGKTRADWFQDTLSKIGDYPGVKGIIYFNRSELSSNFQFPPICDPVDYSLDANGEEGKSEFRDIVTQAPYGYWAQNSTEMTDIAFGRPSAIFEDVWPASSFSEKQTIYYFDEVERLFNSGMTVGCGSTTYFAGDASVSDFTFRYYCPEGTLTRAEVSTFIEKGHHYPDVGSPGDYSPYIFTDSVSHWGKDWIQKFYEDGFTAGCQGPGEPMKFCPDNNVTRQEIVIYLLRGKYHPGYVPPPAVGDIFDDVPGDSAPWATNWIEDAYHQGIWDGVPSVCGSGNFCPLYDVLRGNMAIMLVNTFPIP